MSDDVEAARTTSQLWLAGALVVVVAGLVALTHLFPRRDAGTIKIGFVVKDPQTPWYRHVQRFADQAARKHGVELVKIGVFGPDQTLAAIDRVATSGARGLVMCPADARLGSTIVRRTDAHALKLLSIDDRLLDRDRNVIADVHYLGTSPRRIGQQVGKRLHEEMTRRGWDVDQTGLCAVTFEESHTATERTDGAVAALVAAGFPEDRVYKAHQRVPDAEEARRVVDELLARRSDVKTWLVVGADDQAVLGAVRAVQGRGFGAEAVIGIGIGGADCAGELGKPEPTGFVGSMLLSAKRHGFESVEMMVRWVTEGVEPPKDTRTTATFITRENFRHVLQEQGIED